MSTVQTTLTATTQMCTGLAHLFDVSVSNESGQPGAVELRQTAGGPVVLRIQAPSLDTVFWNTSHPAGVKYPNGIHVTIPVGPTISVSLTFEQGTGI